MSTVSATNLKHASSATNNIVLDASGNTTVSGNAAISGSATVGGVAVVTTTGTQTLTNKTLTSPTITGAVVSSMASSVITLVASKASTSGTSVDFDTIPSWVKRITIMFNGVSTNGTSIPIVQLGSGSPTTSGYLGAATLVDGSVPTYGGANISAGFNLTGNSHSAAYLINGSMVLTSFGSNTWTCAYVGGTSSTIRGFTTGGSIALAGTLDRVRITTVNGTDAFDAGSISIMYE